MHDEGFEFDGEHEEYARLKVLLVDGTVFLGTVKTNKRLSDEVNDQEPFLILSDAVFKTAKGKSGRKKTVFLNKTHVLYALPEE